MVFDSILLQLGLTHDTAVAPVRSSPTFAACCDGSLKLEAEHLYSHFSMPYAVVKRLFPIAEELRAIMSLLSQAAPITTEQSTTYNHRVVQFMRCYAAVAKFCPKFYLSALFEWLIAQCIELAALVQIVRDSGIDGRKYPQLARTCGWVQGNVAFMLCFVRGSHFESLLASDYEQGLEALVNTQTTETDVTPEALCSIMEGLKAQVQRLEQQEDVYSKVRFLCVWDPIPHTEFSSSRWQLPSPSSTRPLFISARMTWSWIQPGTRSMPCVLLPSAFPNWKLLLRLYFESFRPPTGTWIWCIGPSTRILAKASKVSKDSVGFRHM